MGTLGVIRCTAHRGHVGEGRLQKGMHRDGHSHERRGVGHDRVSARGTVKGAMGK